MALAEMSTSDVKEMAYAEVGEGGDGPC